MATAVVVGTLDTKGVEYEYVKQCINNAGVDVILVDTGILGDPQIKPDITSEMVAKAAGKKLSDIRFTREGSDTRAIAINIMSEGLKVVLAKLIDENKCDAVFGMGGSGGTNLISRAMQTLPLGVPKMIVSTMMSGNVQSYVGNCDISMMYSVTDIAGLNQVSKLILANAAHAVAGMALNRNAAIKVATSNGRPLIGITMFGITTPGVLRIRDGLEANGFDTIVFHATGSGGMAMENMILEGHINGVIDYTLAELCDYEFGGIFPAGPIRLTSASKMKIPQVVVPGAIEVLNFGAVETVPEALNVPERKLIVHNPTVCAVKANQDELSKLGKIVAQRLENADGSITELVLPTGGLDAYGEVNGPWYDKESDKVLFDSIKSNLKKEIHVEMVEGNINDKAFADTVLNTFLKLWKKQKNN